MKDFQNKTVRELLPPRLDQATQIMLIARKPDGHFYHFELTISEERQTNKQYDLIYSSLKALATSAFRALFDKRPHTSAPPPIDSSDICM